MPVPAPSHAPSLDFASLVRQHQAMVFSICWHVLRDRAVAEELAQDVFLSLHQHLATLESPEHVQFWLRRVSSNRALDVLRRRQRRPMVSLENAPEPVAVSPKGDPLLGSALRRLVGAPARKGARHRRFALPGGFGSGRNRQDPRHPGRHRQESIAAGTRLITREIVPEPRGDQSMNFEDELRSALRRREPSPDFTARVLARVASAQPPQTVQPWARRPLLRWVSGIAATLILAAGAFEYRQYQGEQAKTQVLQAMRIAASKLNKAQKKVQMMSHRSNS